jgi:hypothetical protein
MDGEKDDVPSWGTNTGFLSTLAITTVSVDLLAYF